MKPTDFAATACRFALAALAAAGLAGAGHAQPPTPTTIDLASFTTIASGGSLGQDGGFTDAAGTAGANPGWSLFRYGTASSSSGRLRITAVSASPATEAYWTATPGSPNTSAAPLNFSSSSGGSWVIITPKPGATAPIQLTVDDNSPNTFFTLTDQSQLGAYNTRLNQVLKFDAAHWYDPATNAPIDLSVGTFAYGFADFDATLGYRSIELQFTPAPEPGSVLAMAATGLGLVAVGHRWARRHRPQGECGRAGS